MITADIQGLEPGEKVQLFELDASGIGGDYFRFHGYQTGEIWWQGKEYSAWPIQAEGFARTGEAQQPAPVLTLGNVDGFRLVRLFRRSGRCETVPPYDVG